MSEDNIQYDVHNYDPLNKYIAWDSDGGEQSGLDVDFLSNGFKMRTSGTGENHSGETHIYAAFAEAPFVNSNGVPCNAR